MKRWLTFFLLTLLFSFSLALPAGAYTLTLTGNDAHDAFVRFSTVDDAAAQTNFGQYPYLSVGTYTDGLPAPQEHRAFLRFDLSQIPKGTTINSAELQLFHESSESGWAHTEVSVHPLLQDWQENLVTWNSQPTLAADPLDSRLLSWHDTGLTWQSWVITSVVQSWIDGTLNNYGLALKELAEANAYDLQVLSSSESSNEAWRPRLILDVTPPDLRKVIASSCRDGLIDNEGIANSLSVKVPDKNLREPRDLPTQDAFGPLINEIKAQTGKHVDEATAAWLLQIIDFIKVLSANS